MAETPSFKLAESLTEEEAKLVLANQGKEETPGLSRAEKKRDREKLRRSEINLGYDHLMDILFRVDPHLRKEAEAQAKRGKDDQPLLNRLEIINGACNVLERLHAENEERKMVILHLSRGLLASGGNNGGLPNPSPPPSLVANSALGAPSAASLAGAPHSAGLGAPNAASLLSRQNIERQELQRQQLEMDALVAARSAVAGVPPLRSSPASFLAESSMGRGLPGQSAAMMGRPLGLGEGNPMADRLGASSLSSQLYSSDLLHGAAGDPRSARLEESHRDYQARLNQLLREGEELQAASAAFGAARSLPGLVSRSSNGVGGIPESSVPMSGDSIRQAMMREQTIAQAAAARSQQGGLPSESMLYGPASKRMRNY